MPSVLVSELTHHEMVGTYIKQMTEKIDKRKKFYATVSDLDNDPLTRTPFDLSQLEDYQAGTKLLESNLQLFMKVFEVKP